MHSDELAFETSSLRPTINIKRSTTCIQIKSAFQTSSVRIIQTMPKHVLLHVTVLADQEKITTHRNRTQTETKVTDITRTGNTRTTSKICVDT